MRRDFTNARSNAKRRGIPWALTFEQWRDVWLESGLWERRGRERDQYQMDRKDPNKGYGAGNVQILLGAENRIKDSLDALHGYYAKLTEEQVKAVRAKYRPRRYTAPMLAEEYAVSVHCIKKIVQGGNWKVLANP